MAATSRPTARQAATRVAVVACALALAVAGLLHLLSMDPLRHDAAVTASCARVSWRTLTLCAAPRWAGGAGDATGAVTAIWKCGQAYHDRAPGFTAAVFCAVYVLLQTFAIPGPLLLSIVAGALYGPWRGQAMIALCATCGATLCYCLSWALAEPILLYAVPARVAALRHSVAGQRAQLVWYMLFLRITPALPNWLVNLASPICGVPLHVFVAATALGLLPANYFHANTGATLSTLAASGNWDLRSNWRSLATLLVLQLAAVAPAVLPKLTAAWTKTRQQRAAAAPAPPPRSPRHDHDRAGSSASTRAMESTTPPAQPARGEGEALRERR